MFTTSTLRGESPRNVESSERKKSISVVFLLLQRFTRLEKTGSLYQMHFHVIGECVVTCVSYLFSVLSKGELTTARKYNYCMFCFYFPCGIL